MASTQPPTQQVFYVGVWKSQMPSSGRIEDAEPPRELAGVTDLRSLNYFTRQAAEPMLGFAAEQAAGKEDARKDRKQKISLEGQYEVHTRGSDAKQGLVGVVIVRAGYAPLAAHSLLTKILEEFVKDHPSPSTWTSSFKYPGWKDYMHNYDDPKNADGILKIQAELDQTKDTLRNTIVSVMERGEKLDDLVAKSDRLSYASKGFYAASKKQNSCCVVM